MDVVSVSQFLPQLGVFGPLALLGAWVIKSQRDTILAKDKRIDELTQTLAVRALHP
jgi:hypothetical protein